MAVKRHVGVFFIMFAVHSEFLVSSSEDPVWEKCSLTCGGGIQRKKANKNETRMCNALNCPDDAGCITAHFTFDTLMAGQIYDTSNNGNHGTVKGKAVLDDDGKFAKCLRLPKNSNVSFGSPMFHNRPISAITVALWVKLTSVEGSRELFHTCASDKPNGNGEYHFEVNDGKVRWFHRDHMGRTVFNIISEASIPAMTWTHIAGSYRTSTRRANIYIDGDISKLSSQLMKFGKNARVDAISPDWGCANIGDYKNERPLDGYVDDFFLLKCELLPLEIKELFQTGSFKRHGIPVPHST